MLCEHVADARSAELIAVRIASALHEPAALVGGQEVRLTAGIGITTTTDPDSDPEVLILEAETALHHAKQRGTGRHELFVREMRSDLHSRIESEDRLREALANNEFRVEYQPKVSLLNERTTGVEALVRWHHPERGVIPPLDFIPLAESSGLHRPHRRVDPPAGLQGRGALDIAAAGSPAADRRGERLAPPVPVGFG